MKSVLQDWVMNLPLRAQGTVLTAIRGCDLTPKFPLDSVERNLVGWIRFAILNPHDVREIGIKGAFFQNICFDFKPSELGHYPLHWVSHIIHTLEVIAYYCPKEEISKIALEKYNDFVRSLHLNPETKEEMIVRLCEDRIALNNVVS